jgi:hypothetical protein
LQFKQSGLFIIHPSPLFVPSAFLHASFPESVIPIMAKRRFIFNEIGIFFMCVVHTVIQQVYAATPFLAF